jgi:hypothetical protein
MILIDFTSDESLNALRKAIGAPLIPWDSSSTWDFLDPLKLRAQLEATGEIEVPLSDLSLQKDGTFEIFGKKVLIYIRDQVAGGSYKFHIANCSTLRKAQQIGRYDRYVVSIRTDGKFKVVEIFGGGSWREERDDVKLQVCRNCLHHLDYQEYRSRYHQRDRIQSKFTVENFFAVYKNTKIIQPKYTDATAPINAYTSDWPAISEAARSKSRYRCEGCNLDYSSRHLRKFLQVHHRSGVKYDNSSTNLEVLCIGCHAEEPAHQHMKSLPDYREWKVLFGDPQAFR